MLDTQHRMNCSVKNMHMLIHYKHRDSIYISAEDCKIYNAFIKGEGTHVKMSFPGVLMVHFLKWKFFHIRKSKMER